MPASGSKLDITTRLELVLEGTNIGTWEWNLETGETIFNERWAGMIGYSLEELGKTDINTWSKFVHPDDLEESDKALALHFEGKSPYYKCEARLKHKDGHWVWILDKGKVVSWDASGEPLWMMGSHIDISDVKSKEILLERYADLLDKSNNVAKIGTWEVDLETLHTHWSSMTRQIHEVEDNEVYAVKNAIDFFKPGNSREIIIRVFNEAIEFGKAYDEELQIITATGKEKWVRAVGIPEMRGGECKRVYGLFQDINDKTEMHEQLAVREKQFRNTFEFAPNGIALVGLDGSWLTVNTSLCAMLGYTEEELSKMTFTDITHVDDIDRDWSLVKELLEGKRTSYEMEKRYIHKNGSEIWAILAVSLVRSEKGEPLHFVSQINNISEVKQAQIEIQNLLDVTREQNDRLLNFAHIVSHNLRSHVGNFSMLLDLLELEVPESTENDFFPLLKHSTESLQETIMHLNEVVALKSNKTATMIKLDLGRFVEKACMNLQGEILESEVEIVNAIPAETKINGVAAYLDSILINFLSNAIKYRSRERKPQIRLSLKLEEPYTILSIQDNGMGIDLNIYGKKLFGMYKTFHGNKDARGVGLFLSKNQIEAMKGRIEVESTVNKGTNFSLYFVHAKN